METSDDPARNVFAPAFIMPIPDGGGGNHNGGNVTFALNVPDADIENQVGFGRQSGTNDADDFWVVYIQTSYQGRPLEDFDPNSEKRSFWPPQHRQAWRIPSRGIVASRVAPTARLIFTEVHTDSRAPTDIGVPHEIGHQFGLLGGAMGFGIMTESFAEPAVFTPAHLNMLRCRVRVWATSRSLEDNYD